MLDEMLKPAWPEPQAETPEGKAQKSERTQSQHETLESRRDIYGKHQAGEYDFLSIQDALPGADEHRDEAGKENE